MFKFPSSIRQKITMGYCLSVAVIIAGVIITYSNLSIIENKIMLSNVVSELFETTLEIRRFEKNYFLFKEEKDYFEILRFINNAEILIEMNKNKFKGLVSMPFISDLETTLGAYRKLIVNHKAELKTSTGLEQRVRKKGKELVTLAENITSLERSRIRTLLSNSRRFIIVSIVFLIVTGIAFGYLLLQSIVKPLKALEETMLKISNKGMEKVLINSSDREIVSLSGAFNTMLKELELRQMRLVTQSDKLASLGTMVSGVAHQLNNPLSNISTSCQILTEEIEEGDVDYKKRLLQQVEGEIERAKSLVFSLLQFSRKKDFKNEQVALNALLNDTLKLLRGDIPSGLNITTDIPGDICIIADKQRMEHAILNIIKNGIDVLSEEGSIAISAVKNAEEKNVEIRITDSGIGIEPQNVGRIFEPFFTTKDEAKGSGLGLFVTREIIKEHGGVIEVDSKMGEGTTFIIKLPVKEC